MKCTEFELLLCEYLDGTLTPAEKAEADAHLATCGECAELKSDAAGAVAFMERAAVVEVPPQLVTKILQQVPSRQPVTVKARSAFGRMVAKWLEPVLQPRLVMGMAMTILSFAMLGRFAGIEARQLKPADLHPVKILEATEDRAHRTWNKAVKYYQSLKIVYELQSLLRDLSESEEGTQQPDGGPERPSTPATPGAENTGTK